MSRKRLPISLLFCFFICSCSFIFSCSSSISGYPSLVNQGPLPLSPTNPYVGTNLFLAEEFQKSSDLYNFLKGRGAPAAIEIIEEGVQVPRMRMFYTKDKQYYIGDLQRLGDQSQWVVRGPFAITRQEYRRLPKDSSSMPNEPVFAYGNSNSFRFIEERPEPATVVAIAIPTPKPTPKRKTRKVITAPENPVVPKETGEAARMGESSGRTFDQQAIEMSKGNVERNEGGDVVHVVKKSGQTVKDIVQWYSHSTENAAEIAKKNQLPLDQPLPVGKTVVIPSILVKEFKQMP